MDEATGGDGGVECGGEAAQDSIQGDEGHDFTDHATLNVSKGAVVHKVREVKETMSQDYLMKHCKEFFQGDEEKAKQLVTYLEEHRAASVKHDLRILPSSGTSDSGSR